MFTLESPEETRAVVGTALVSCIYLPTVVAIISYFGQLYYVGKSSSAYILVFFCIAEFLKVSYLNRSYSGDGRRRGKLIKSRASDTLKVCLLCLCSVVAYFVGIILFGAPILEEHEETFMLSTLLTIVTVFPLARYVGVEQCLHLLSGVKSSAGDSATAMFVRNAIGTVCGTWVGAVVIPLDWNRPWQVWPVPCYLGALGGYLLANVFTIIHHLTPLKFHV